MTKGRDRRSSDTVWIRVQGSRVNSPISAAWCMELSPLTDPGVEWGGSTDSIVMNLGKYQLVITCSTLGEGVGNQKSDGGLDYVLT